MPLLRELTVYVYPSTFSRFADKIIQLYLSTLSRNMEHAIFRSPPANTSYWKKMSPRLRYLEFFGDSFFTSDHLRKTLKKTLGFVIFGLCFFLKKWSANNEQQ